MGVGDEGESGFGRVDGRPTALTVVVPLRWLGRFWHMVLCALYAVPPFRRGFKKLDQLEFIYAIRWTLLPPFRPRTGWSCQPDQRWQLLFESNFDGDWDEYLNDFGSVVGPGLVALVALAVGYTGLDTLSLFKAWAKANDHVPEHYASAYPTVTAIDIREGLANANPTETIAHLRGWYGWLHPKWATYLMPLQPGASAAAAAAAHALEREPTGRAQLTSQLLVDDAGPPDGPGLRPLGVHFVRLTILEYPSGSWLLFTLVYDGRPPIRAVLEGMLQSDGRTPSADGTGRPGPLHRLLACADGVPGPDVAFSDEDLVSFVLSNRPSSAWATIKYCGYPKRRARQIADLAVDPTLHQGWPAPRVGL